MSRKKLPPIPAPSPRDVKQRIKLDFARAMDIREKHIENLALDCEALLRLNKANTCDALLALIVGLAHLCGQTQQDWQPHVVDVLVEMLQKTFGRLPPQPPAPAPEIA